MLYKTVCGSEEFFYYAICLRMVVLNYGEVVRNGVCMCVWAFRVRMC